MDIPIASTVSIRESGFDEYWLQVKCFFEQLRNLI